jgi:hypothetical protein
MKIEFTENQELIDLARTVNRGDTLVSPSDAPEELLQSYVANGIAKEVGVGQKPFTPKDPQNTAGGE